MTKPSLTDFVNASTPAKAEPVAAPTKQGEGIISITIRLPRSRWKRLADLSTDERTPIQRIVIDALEKEFARRGLTL